MAIADKKKALTLVGDVIGLVRGCAQVGLMVVLDSTTIIAPSGVVFS